MSGGGQPRLALRKTGSVKMATVATAVVVVTALGAAGVSAARPVAQRSATGSSKAHGPSVIGTYSYADSVGDTGAIDLNADQTVTFSNGCSGLWVTRKKTIAFDFDSSSCNGDKVIFTGSIAGKKLTGTGEGLGLSSGAFTWSATKLA